MGEIKVSVIIPVFNKAKYLSECLDSVLTQTLDHVEIICIDDGSYDETPVILGRYSAVNRYMQIIRTENQGAALARNRGISTAKGKYVIFMDADDYYPSTDVLETLYNLAEKYKVKAAGGSFAEINMDGKIRQGDDYTEKCLYGYHFAQEGVLDYSHYQFDYGYTRFLFNREMLVDNSIFFPDLSFFEDPPFFVRAMSLADHFAVTPKTVYMYRIGYSERTWSRKNTEDLYKGLFMNLQYAKEKGYQDLFNLTMSRMYEEYEYVIQYHVETLKRLELLAKENAGLIEDKKQLKRLTRALNPYQGVAANSYSYKIGLWITFIPRKILHIAERIIN